MGQPAAFRVVFVTFQAWTEAAVPAAQQPRRPACKGLNPCPRTERLRPSPPRMGIATDRTFGAVAPPLYLSSTFAFAGFEKARDYDYTRTANPSRATLADTIARLEGGAGAIVVSSGMAGAVDLVLSRLRSNDLILAPHDCYAGTRRLLAARRDRGQFDVTFVDQGDDVALASAFNRLPTLVLV